MLRSQAVPLDVIKHRLRERRRAIESLRAADPWRRTARPNQIPPAGDWTTWLIMAGRGFGKTRSGAEWVRETAMAAGKGFVIHLVGPTVDAVRDIMVEGESGVLACCERYGFPATYEPNRRRIRFGNGAIARCYSAETPNRLRGPQCHAAWSDEVAAWEKPEAWDQLQFGLRLKWAGREPQQIATTTPKPVTVVREILKLDGLVVTKGTTYENRANLAEAFFNTIIRKYEGSRLGQQELEGILLDDVEGAFWSWAVIEAARVGDIPRREPTADQRAAGDPGDPMLRRIVIGIDPATTYGEKADETAILAAGVDFAGETYVLEGWHGKIHPDDWSRMACLLYVRLKADAIVAEANNGGELVRSSITHAWADLVRNGAVVGPAPAIKLIHAKRGKEIRAEPVSVLYQQKRVHHVTSILRDGDGRPLASSLSGFEDQMVLFPVAHEDRDDRVDALVHAVAELTGGRDTTLRAA